MKNRESSKLKKGRKFEWEADGSDFITFSKISLISCFKDFLKLELTKALSNKPFKALSFQIVRGLTPDSKRLFTPHPPPLHSSLAPIFENLRSQPISLLGEEEKKRVREEEKKAREYESKKKKKNFMPESFSK